MDRENNDFNDKIPLTDEELSTISGARDAWKTMHDLAWEAVDREDYGWYHFFIGACLAL